MLIVTGVLLAFVLVVMVGATVRTMQGAGWLPIHSIDVDLPYWLGTWLGVFPTWETLGAQVVALAFVIGSYYAAEYVRITRPRRQAALRKEADGAPRPADAAAEPAAASSSACARPRPARRRRAGAGRGPRRAARRRARPAARSARRRRS